MFLSPKKNVFNYHDPPISHIFVKCRWFNIVIIDPRHPQNRAFNSNNNDSQRNNKEDRPHLSTSISRFTFPPAKLSLSLCVTRVSQSHRTAIEGWSKIEPFILPRNIDYYQSERRLRREVRLRSFCDAHRDEQLARVQRHPPWFARTGSTTSKLVGENQYRAPLQTEQVEGLVSLVPLRAPSKALLEPSSPRSLPFLLCDFLSFLFQAYSPKRAAFPWSDRNNCELYCISFVRLFERCEI